MAGRLEIDLVGEVEPVGLTADLLTVLSPRPLPPGTRVTLSEGGGGGLLAQGKIASVGASAPVGGVCELSVRLFAPERQARERLEALVGHQKKEPPR